MMKTLNGEMMEPADVKGMRELRLVLIGKTRSGKSTSGNTILGRKHFQSKCSSKSITKVCMEGRADLTWEDDSGLAFGRRPEARARVLVVDVPGFGDTNLNTEECHREVAKSVTLSAPGPHAFLLVVPIGSYTEDESRAVEQMAKIFGEAAVRNRTVILFTRGDDLEEGDIEEYLRDAVPKLKALKKRCGGRYHVLNNKDPGDREQVRQLLRKVEAMVEGNGGGCYTNEMYLVAEAAIREQQERLIREPRRAERGVSSFSQFRTEAALSPNLLERIKILVATALAGVVVGAAFGALAPLAAAGGAALVGNAVASQLAATTVLWGGAAFGGGVGGSMGVMNGLGAANVQDGVIDTLKQVGTTGVAVAGMAFVGGVLFGAAGDIVAGSGSVQSTGATTSSGLVESALDSASSGLVESTVDAASSGLVDYARDAVSCGLVDYARDAASSGLGESARDAIISGLGESTRDAVISGLGESTRDAVISGLGESTRDAVISGLGESAPDAVSSRLVESIVNTATAGLALGMSAIAVSAKCLSVTAKIELEEVRSGTGAHADTYSQKRYLEISWNKKEENEKKSK